MSHTHFIKTDSEGFELSVPFGTAVFKTAALDHSANCPYALGGGRTHKTRILSPIRMPVPSQEQTWVVRDSNPRPSRCKRDALTN